MRNSEGIKKLPTKELVTDLVCVYSDKVAVEVDEGALDDSEEIRFEMPRYCVIRITELARRRGCSKATFCRMIFVEGLKVQGDK